MSNIQDVFVSKSLDSSQTYEVVRIPAFCRTERGTLIAMAEGRLSIADQSSNVLIMRRRLRGQNTWGSTQVVATDPSASLNNPCLLPTKKKLWMMYQSYPNGLMERTVSTGFDPAKTCRSFVISSSDEGQTWSEPVEITKVVKGAEIQSIASGPGIGIEFKRGPHKGRLAFPFNEGINGNWNAFAVYSDDQGKTWRRGENVPKPAGIQPNEAQFFETMDGSLRLNARNQASGKFRLTSLSKDGGQTWSMAEPIPELPDPTCMGSVLRVSFKPNIVAFSNPADAGSRSKGTVRLSQDDGRTWSPGVQIVQGSFEYSSLFSVSKSALGILFETREFSPAGKEGYRIRYQELSLKDLLGSR